MGFNWRSPVVPRVAMMAATIFLFCFFTFSGNEWIYALFFLAVSLFQIKLLIEYLDRSNANIASFLDSISFDDLSYSFKTESDDPVVQRLCDISWHNGSDNDQPGAEYLQHDPQAEAPVLPPC